MHHNTTREITNAPLCQEAAAPYHVDKRIINQYLPQNEENKVALKRNPIDERPGYERRSDDRKHHLVSKKYKLGNVAAVGCGKCRIEINAMHKRLVKVADDAAHNVAAEAHGIAERIPQNSSDAHGYKTLYHNAQDIALACEAAVKEREAGSHKHYQTCGEEHKARGAGIKRSHQ